MRATRVYSIIGALMLLIFFIVFHVGALHVYFGDDETMNLYGYWSPPLGNVALANVLFWSKFVRPMGAIYYLPLYEIFGLNPVPFTITRLAILLVNTVWFYYLAVRLLRSRWMALLAAFPVAYHAGMGALAYKGAFIYDVLCGGFYFSALLYYVRYRRTNGLLGVRPVCIFLALYLCALNSKEMAVSLPVIILAYEVFTEKGGLSRFAAPLIAGALTLVYIVGKTHGADTLTSMEAYRPVLSWARFSESNTRFLNTIFYTDLFTMRGVLAAWVLLLYLGLRKRDPRWLVLLIWVVVTPLPVAFIPGRDGPVIYIVAAGWAMAAAMIARAVALAVAREPVLCRIPRRMTTAAALLPCGAVYAHETRLVDRKEIPGYRVTEGQRTRDMIRQLRAFDLRPAPRSKIVFLNDPLPEGFGAEFIGYLVWGDRSLRIEIQRYSHLTDAEIAARDYVFDYVDGRLVLSKR